MLELLVVVVYEGSLGRAVKITLQLVESDDKREGARDERGGGSKKGSWGRRSFE